MGIAAHGVLVLALTLAACGGDEPASTADSTAKTAAQLETISQQYCIPALGAPMIDGDQVTFLDAPGVSRLGAPAPVTKADVLEGPPPPRRRPYRGLDGQPSRRGRIDLSP